MNINEIQINGEIYVKKADAMAKNTEGLPYVIVRGDRSGVFAGYLSSRDGRYVKLLESRRLWYWDGAASISQIAIDGVSKPENCKFPVALPEHEILDAIEVIYATEKARKSIGSVKVWKK